MLEFKIYYEEFFSDYFPDFNMIYKRWVQFRMCQDILYKCHKQKITNNVIKVKTGERLKINILYFI